MRAEVRHARPDRRRGRPRAALPERRGDAGRRGRGDRAWPASTPARDVALAVDVASSHFYHDGRYHLGDGAARQRREMIEHARRTGSTATRSSASKTAWPKRTGRNWPALRERLAGRALVLGDDFLCTNPARIRRAIDADAADALLLKVNQIGTLTEAAEALRPGARRRLARHRQRPQRRDRRRLAGRPRRRLGRRPDQGRLDHPVRAPGQIQPPAGDRSRTAGCRWWRGRDSPHPWRTAFAGPLSRAAGEGMRDPLAGTPASGGAGNLRHSHHERFSPRA